MNPSPHGSRRGQKCTTVRSAKRQSERLGVDPTEATGVRGAALIFLRSYHGFTGGGNFDHGVAQDAITEDIAPL